MVFKLNKKEFLIHIGGWKKYYSFKLHIHNKGEVEFLWSTYDKHNKKKRKFWWCYSNEKHNTRIWGEGKYASKYHLCIIIPGFITLDTAHVGKKIFGEKSRINLCYFLKKDYKVYSSGEGVSEMGSD